MRMTPEDIWIIVRVPYTNLEIYKSFWLCFLNTPIILLKASRFFWNMPKEKIFSSGTKRPAVYQMTSDTTVASSARSKTSEKRSVPCMAR